MITGGYKDDKRLTDIVYKLCICHDGIVRKNKPGCLDGEYSMAWPVTGLLLIIVLFWLNEALLTHMVSYISG